MRSGATRARLPGRGRAAKLVKRCRAAAPLPCVRGTERAARGALRRPLGIWGEGSSDEEAGAPRPLRASGGAGGGQAQPLAPRRKDSAESPSLPGGSGRSPPLGAAGGGRSPLAASSGLRAMAAARAARMNSHTPPGRDLERCVR